jgi:hypothetical protein
MFPYTIKIIVKKTEHFFKKCLYISKGRVTVHSKKLFCIACLFLLVLGVAGTLWAQGAIYNRPNPLMDYVPQELGFYDTDYTNWDEAGCRSCHGYSIADRHHGVPMVVNDHQCYTCHPLCTKGAPHCENGITINRNCLTSGCHSWNDVQYGNQKWHHNTDLSDPENCVVCHNPNLVEEIGPFRSFVQYPPSVVTPTPFSCENCHWEQDVVNQPGTPNAPGHPSTYEHKDVLGDDVGFYEYTRPIFNNIDTHHMDFVGNVASDCDRCHSQDPDLPSWDPNNPELIRYCEICHSIRTLHIIQPHLADTNGWAAIGFHAGGGGSVPTTYRKFGDLPYVPPQVNPGFYLTEMCWACHADNVVPYEWFFTYVPAIDTIGGISPTAGSCGMIGQLRGNFFGEEQFEGSNVQMKLKADPLAPWISVPIRSWTDSLIEFQIPCWTFAPGNYLVRVHTEAGYYNNGNSNRVVFTMMNGNGGPQLNITPASGPCSTIITLSGYGFENERSRILPGQTYYGIDHVVDFVASNGEFTATKYMSWSDSQIQVKVYNWFQDGTDTCSIDPNTGQPRNERNFVQDIGDENADASITCDNTAPIYDECAAEPVLKACNELGLGAYSVYVKTIYFGDDDASGDLSCGDTIYQVWTSGPVTFEITNDPYIRRLNPKQITDVDAAPYPLLKIFGGNFGLTQEDGDSVRIGNESAALKPALGRGKEQTKVVLWSNTLIKVRAKQIPNAWRGKKMWVWVEKGGIKSNIKPLSILSP